MATFDFTGYTANCQRIAEAFKILPDFNSDAVMHLWENGKLFVPHWIGSKFSRWAINVGAHMAATAVAGYSIGKICQDELKSEGFVINDIVEALLIHDWDKIISISNTDPDPDIDYPKQVARFEENAGLYFSEKIIRLACSPGNGMIIISNQRPLNLAEMICSYSDFCTSGDQICTYEERMNDLLPHFRPGGRYENWGKLFQEKYNMSHRQKCDSLIKPIEKYLAALCGFDNPEFITSIVPKYFLKRI